MFGITYETWHDVCQMYMNLGMKSQKCFLQWFPFTKLSDADIATMLSEQFYNKYIASGGFCMYPAMMHRSENYIQKGDGSFRDASLVSPILYLVLQAIGKEISNKYSSVRDSSISVYYAGNYEFMRAKYKHDYDDFFKEINAYTEEYPYFIKTDITSFFSNISIDKLIARVDLICNSETLSFSPAQLQLFREILAYCGDGRYPLIENSIASSYLATVVYLDEIDCRLFNFIIQKLPSIQKFKMIRYVDDLYIMIASDGDFSELHEAYNRIRNEYSSLLKEFGLAINSKKCRLGSVQNISEELKKSLYDEFYNGEKKYLPEYFSGSIVNFINSIEDALSRDCIDIERYNDIIEASFSDSNIVFTPSEVFNYFVYEEDSQIQSVDVVQKIISLLQKDISFISLDPKRLTAMVMKSKSSVAIKALLNQLFKRHRANIWNSYDTSIAISYLIQSEFRHIDLLNIFSLRCKPLYSYYFFFCRVSFMSLFDNKKRRRIVDIVSGDSKAVFLYFMYLFEKSKHNSLSSFAFFKNYFDRMSADLAFYSSYDNNGKKANYKRFYKEGELKKLYVNQTNSVAIIENAHKLRNANPLSHASAELIDRTNTSSDLDACIVALEQLIEEFVDSLPTE